MTGDQKRREFMKVFNSLCTSRQAWQVWSDWISACACFISLAVDRDDRKEWENRCKEFQASMARIGNNQKAQELFDIMVDAFEAEPDQDFLGSIYMELGLGSHWHGQFFTPISLCRLMAEITIGKSIDALDGKNWIGVADPACGAGATLIAAAGAFRQKGINYQQRVLFAGQDVDRVVAQMCYIQLSLLGCAGYIVVGNTLTNPMTGPELVPDKKPGLEIWYMPFLMVNEIWQFRRMLQLSELRVTKEYAELRKKERDSGRWFIFQFDHRKEVQDAG